jgi:large subunit ribosomal protein L28
MAQVCDICGKGPQFGNNISHAHNVTRRRWNVNLQAVKALVNGAPKRIRVCTSCIKAGKISKAYGFRAHVTFRIDENPVHLRTGFCCVRKPVWLLSLFEGQRG